MIDSETKERVLVYAPENAWPYIMLPNDQLESVESILKANRADYWVDPYTISINGKAPISMIEFGRGTDVGQIQRELDGVY